MKSFSIIAYIFCFLFIVQCDSSDQDILLGYRNDPSKPSEYPTEGHIPTAIRPGDESEKICRNGRAQSPINIESLFVLSLFLCGILLAFAILRKICKSG